MKKYYDAEDIRFFKILLGVAFIVFTSVSFL